VDFYFSADVETDGPIPGPYSMLSFAIVAIGASDGKTLSYNTGGAEVFYRELTPISDKFQIEALAVNGLDRDRLSKEGQHPAVAMKEAFQWVKQVSRSNSPVLVAYPLAFDWTWLYWYFVNFCEFGSPFDYSRCYDIKTAFAVKSRLPISEAGRSRLPMHLRSAHRHTHHAVDDAIAQAEIFRSIFEWRGE
jgi:hypothetical protein